MSRDSIHREIKELIELLEIHHNRLYLKSGELHKLDLAQLRNLTVQMFEQIDRLELYRTKMEDVDAVRDESIDKVISEEPITIPEQLEEVKDALEEVVEEVSEPEQIDEIIEEIVEEIEEKMDTIEEDIVEEVVEENRVKEVKAEPLKEEVQEEIEESPKATENKEEDHFLNDLKSKSKHSNLYERLSHSKLDSIKKAISISKRYELQNELFQKDPNNYNESIALLDSAGSIEEAFGRFDDLKAKFKWEDEDELVEELQTILLRRYM